MGGFFIPFLLYGFVNEINRNPEIQQKKGAQWTFVVKSHDHMMDTY